MKQCARCGTTKPAAEFNRSASNKDGRHSYCRSCMKEYLAGVRAPIVHPPRPCAFCETPFVPLDRRGTYCSNNCKMAARRQRLRSTEPRYCQQCGADVTHRRKDMKWCSEKCVAAAKRADGRSRSIARRSRLKRYGLTTDSYEALLAAQGGGCAICQSTEPRTHHGFWHVDHDHQCCNTDNKLCGRCTRGLLCGPCNLALGHFEDDPARLRAAIRYLTKEVP